MVYLSLRGSIARGDAPAGTTSDPAGVVGADGPSRFGEPSGGRVEARGRVLALGLTSFFTDISSEMVRAVIPLYLTTAVGFGTGSFGALDGFLFAASILLIGIGGMLVDRGGRPKPLAVGGYGVSAACKAGLVLVANPVPLLFLDRLGKGLRTVPRDALISLHATPSRLGRAFALHRSLDTAGAMLGPVLAFFLLRRVPDDYRLVFSIALIAAIAGLFPILIGVPDVKTADHSQAVLDRVRSSRANTEIRRLALAAGLLGLVAVTDAVLYLALFRKTELAAAYFPLLFVGSSLSYLLLAMPMGWLGDRLGKGRVILTGHIFLFAAYAFALGADRTSLGLVVVVLACHGAYYAATDGQYSALASSISGAKRRGGAISSAIVAHAIGRLVAGAGFGALWAWSDADRALIIFAAITVLTAMLAAPLLSSIDRAARSASGADASSLAS